jgi:hypothetical protein
MITVPILGCQEPRIHGYGANTGHRGTPAPIDRSGSRFEIAPTIRCRQRTGEAGAAYDGRRRRGPGHSAEAEGGRGGDVRVGGRAGGGGREAVQWVEHGGGGSGGGGDAGEVGQGGEASLSLVGSERVEGEVVAGWAGPNLISLSLSCFFCWTRALQSIDLPSDGSDLPSIYVVMPPVALLSCSLSLDLSRTLSFSR